MTDAITISCKSIKNIYDTIDPNVRKTTDTMISSGCKNPTNFCTNILKLMGFIPVAKKVIDMLTVTETSVLVDLLCPLFFSDCCTKGEMSSVGSLVLDCNNIKRIVYTFLDPQKNRDIIYHLISIQSKDIKDNISSIITPNDIQTLPGELLVHKVCSQLPFAYQEDMEIAITNIIEKNKNYVPTEYRDMIKTNIIAISNCLCPLPKKPDSPLTPSKPVIDTLKRKLYMGISVGIGFLLIVVLKLFRVSTGLSILVGILLACIGVALVWFDPFCWTKPCGQSSSGGKWVDITGNYEGDIKKHGISLNMSVSVDKNKGIINTLKCDGSNCPKADFLSGITDRSFYIDSTKDPTNMGYLLLGPVIDELKKRIMTRGKPSIHNIWAVRKGNNVVIKVYIRTCPPIIGCIDPVMDIPIKKLPSVVSASFNQH